MASTQENTVRARAVRKRFPMGEGYLEALKGIDLEIKRGEYISIMGPSGSGKTTLFNMIGGLDKPSDGTVYIDEVDIAQLDAYELAWLRCRKIGYIFQTFNLIPVMTALENVTLPMIFAGLSNDEAISKGRGLLETVASGNAGSTSRRSSPAGSSSALRLRGPSRTIPPSFWRTSRRQTSTSKPDTTSSSSSASSTKRWASPSSPTRTTPAC